MVTKTITIGGRKYTVSGTSEEAVRRHIEKFYGPSKEQLAQIAQEHPGYQVEWRPEEPGVATIKPTPSTKRKIIKEELKKISKEHPGAQVEWHPEKPEEAIVKERPGPAPLRSTPTPPKTSRYAPTTEAEAREFLERAKSKGMISGYSIERGMISYTPISGGAPIEPKIQPQGKYIHAPPGMIVENPRTIEERFATPLLLKGIEEKGYEAMGKVFKPTKHRFPTPKEIWASMQTSKEARSKGMLLDIFGASKRWSETRKEAKPGVTYPHPVTEFAIGVPVGVISVPLGAIEFMAHPVETVTGIPSGVRHMWGEESAAKVTGHVTGALLFSVGAGKILGKIRKPAYDWSKHTYEFESGPYPRPDEWYVYGSPWETTPVEESSESLISASARAWVRSKMFRGGGGKLTPLYVEETPTSVEDFLPGGVGTEVTTKTGQKLIQLPKVIQVGEEASLAKYSSVSTATAEVVSAPPFSAFAVPTTAGMLGTLSLIESLEPPRVEPMAISFPTTKITTRPVSVTGEVTRTLGKTLGVTKTADILGLKSLSIGRVGTVTSQMTRQITTPVTTQVTTQVTTSMEVVPPPVKLRLKLPPPPSMGFGLPEHKTARRRGRRGKSYSPWAVRWSDPMKLIGLKKGRGRRTRKRRGVDWLKI